MALPTLVAQDVPFTAAQGDGGLDVASVVQNDLEGSGRFKALAREQLPARPTRAEDVAAPAWKNAGSDYVVVGRVTALDGGKLQVDFDLVNTLTGVKLASQRFLAVPSSLRNAAHRVSDAVYQKILGVRGAFATHVAYVAVEGEPPTQRYQLYVADADGANQRRILESPRPLMSPAWSPDGQWLAYVSFETKHSAVYVQLVATGERRQVSARAGINGAPAWSPDGKKLALTLGGGAGNLDIYVLDMGTQALTRITDDPARLDVGDHPLDGEDRAIAGQRILEGFELRVSHAGAHEIHHPGRPAVVLERGDLLRVR
jgi:TolB protein